MLIYLGSCVEILDTDGPFLDATEMAQCVEDGIPIEFPEFPSPVVGPAEVFQSESNPNLIWFYNDDLDIHWFFQTDLT